ncbi:hypothetical protein LCI18_004263 [Fusarium solani-melongenae]|uniref:Uncharacterized protein n=1 Tax=Fusarium solani subsp. cucurbitae TaxID=2747967 RepID=A0ACD3YWW3_FUSSC|nr:hypothetical protein LCI18_004263 [Fusarium solani-melongenae]
MYLDPKFQIYLVSRPVDKDGVLGIYPRSIGVPALETAKADSDRLLAPDNQQKVFVMRPDLIISRRTFYTAIAAASKLFYNDTLNRLKVKTMKPASSLLTM